MKTVIAGILVAFWAHLSIVLGIICPNHQDRCPSLMTCCILSDGTYGCCPYQAAQCCSDKIHCCPPGTQCNVKGQSCDSLSVNFPYRWMVSVYPKDFITKNYAGSNVVERPEELDRCWNRFHQYTERCGSCASKPSSGDLPQERVKCPDGHTCAGDATCCQMPTRNFGCCLYSNANCCSDREHCCPEDYICDLDHNRCVSKLSTTNELPSYISNVPLFDLKTGTYEVMSPPLDSDPRPECDSERRAIRCKPARLRSRPASEAVCGEGEDCKRKNDPGRFLFLKSSGRIDHFDVVCPDKTHACPTASTCCELSSGSYGCCPLAEATCCPDKKHCCPNGYVCDENVCERKPSLDFFQDTISTPWNRVFGPGL